jgi:hypothetical protein
MRRAAVGVTNGNFRAGDYYQYRTRTTDAPPPKLDIITELTERMNDCNAQKKNNLVWAVKVETGACLSCRMAIKLHRLEKDLAEQIRITALVQWQEESEATRKTDYPS